MEFKALDRVTHLAGYGISGDESLIKEVLSKSFDDIALYKLFKAELEKNSTECSTPYQSKLLFKHYLFALDEVFTNTISMLTDNYKSWSFSFTITPRDTNKERPATEFEKYLIEIDMLCRMVLDELEIVMFKYGMDIFEITYELKSQKMLHTVDSFCEISKTLIFLKENDETLKPINWLKSEQALRQFIEALKENGLIQERDTEVMMQHFIVNGKEPNQSKLEPINWLKSKALLAYLIDQLTTKPKLSNPFIDSYKKWEMTKLHFVVNNKPILRSLINDLKQSMYPNGCTEIDSIINKLVTD